MIGLDERPLIITAANAHRVKRSLEDRASL